MQITSAAGVFTICTAILFIAYIHYGLMGWCFFLKQQQKPPSYNAQRAFCLTALLLDRHQNINIFSPDSL